MKKGIASLKKKEKNVFMSKKHKKFCGGFELY